MKGTPLERAQILVRDRTAYASFDWCLEWDGIKPQVGYEVRRMNVDCLKELRATLDEIIVQCELLEGALK